VSARFLGGALVIGDINTLVFKAELLARFKGMGGPYPLRGSGLARWTD